MSDPDTGLGGATFPLYDMFYTLLYLNNIMGKKRNHSYKALQRLLKPRRVRSVVSSAEKGKKIFWDRVDKILKGR